MCNNNFYSRSGPRTLCDTCQKRIVEVAQANHLLLEHTCCMCGVKFDPEFTTQHYCTDCNKDIGQVMQFNHAIPEDKMDEHSIYVEIEDLRSRVRVLEVELKRERSIKHIITPNPILNDLTYKEKEEFPLKNKTVYAFINKMVEILDAFKGGKPMMSNQGQAMDGYAALAHFTDLAEQAKKEITHDRG